MPSDKDISCKCKECEWKDVRIDTLEKDLKIILEEVEEHKQAMKGKARISPLQYGVYPPISDSEKREHTFMVLERQIQTLHNGITVLLFLDVAIMILLGITIYIMFK